jgi:hypothetical protein
MNIVYICSGRIKEINLLLQSFAKIINSLRKVSDCHEIISRQLNIWIERRTALDL